MTKLAHPLALCAREPLAGVHNAQRPRLPSDPILLKALPDGYAFWREVNKAIQPPKPSPAAAQSQSATSGVSRGPKPTGASSPAPIKPVAAPRRPKGGYQPHDVYAAIDRHDIVTLSDIRDQNFPLFLLSQNRQSPLLYAMQLGPKYKDMCVVLVGFLSRWVNRVDDATLAGSNGREIFRSLRANLRWAIDFGAENNMTEPLSSYLQVLVMSEGDPWLQQAIHSVADTVRQERPREAFVQAQAAVDRFISASLSARDVSSVNDYRFNATADVLMMACSLTLGGEDAPVSLSAFARDERVHNEVLQRLKKAQSAALAEPKTRKQVRLIDQCERVLAAVGQAMGSKTLPFEGKTALVFEKLSSQIAPRVSRVLA